ncbi:MAG: LysR family transcriptional regulator [Gemmobacter sp.]
MWDALRLFAAVARAGSFAGAAAETGLSAVTLARRIGRLEADLGTVLLLRGPEGVVPTEAGRRLFAEGAGPLAGMADLAGFARRLGEAAQSPVRVSATEPVIAEILAPALPRLVLADPALRLHLCVADAVVNLSRHEAEVAIRLARPEGDSLMVRRLARLDMGLYGRADVPPDAMVIGYDDKYGEIAERRWLRTAGLEAQVRVRTSSTRSILAAVAAGAGIGVLPALLAERAGGLVPVPGHPPVPPRDIWMMAHRDVARQPQVRTVMRWIVAAFRAAGDGRGPPVLSSP